MPQEANTWIELLKTFGLPTVLLFIVSYALWDIVKWIRTKLTDLVEKCANVISDNTSALRDNTISNERVVSALDKRHPGSI